MMSHGLSLITVDKRAAGARWSCSCGACGFCWPDGPFDQDDDSRAAGLYVAAQDAHRRHVAGALIADSPVNCDRMRRRLSWYCPFQPPNTNQRRTKWN